MTIAFPEDTYLVALGRFVYAAAALEGLIVTEIAARDFSLPSGLRSDAVAEKTLGGLRQALDKHAAEVSDADFAAWLRRAAAAIADVVPVRNDGMHAHAASAPDGEQRLYRWAPRKGRTTFITSELLATMTAQLVEANTRLTDSRLKT